MKKFLVGVIAALLVTGGLVTSAQVSASAAPYPGTVATKTIAAGVQSSKPHHAKVFVKVTSYGHGQPSGHLDFTFVNKKTGKVYTFGRSYDGPSKYFFSGLSKGRYSISIVFTPPDDSKYKPSAAKTSVRVK